ncbi:hypothetical protein BKA67DRAFT_320084 [Truncatella angustata]|uniref:Uncharacterized protein n=1 Tax=Truncatella angustata TaxID=152316 RepID=A0A9P8ZWY1_9PEZI|nr:uncharacterized protein BKA67DRAFT_320084 [Truncatella angustata]KAH6653402.1 hypothetical protein BKA67DRAFT_320084 [Truncatella angustata]
MARHTEVYVRTPYLPGVFRPCHCTPEMAPHIIHLKPPHHTTPEQNMDKVELHARKICNRCIRLCNHTRVHQCTHGVVYINPAATWAKCLIAYSQSCRRPRLKISPGVEGAGLVSKIAYSFSTTSWLLFPCSSSSWRKHCCRAW